MNDVKNFLEGEILDEFDTLQELDRGSEEHSRAVDDICKMCKTLGELEKIEKDTTQIRVSEARFNQVIGALTLMLNAANIAYGYKFDDMWMRNTLEFEKEGIIRSNKPLFSFKPRRRK